MTINQDGKYFNVHIENDHYYITRSTEKQGKNSAITNLKNIEEILSKNLTYADDPDHANDYYAKMSDGERFKLLKDGSEEIKDNYKKTVKSNIFYRIFSHKKEIHALQKNIQSIINPAEKNPGVIGHIIQKEFIKYLPVSDLISLSMLNKAATGLTDGLIKNLAQELRFVEKENTLTPKEYLKELFDAVDKLHKAGLIPEKYIVYLNKKKGSIDAKQTLLNLKKLSDKDLIDLLSYRSSPTQIILYKAADKILNIINFKDKVLNLHNSSNDNLFKAETVLVWSAENNKKELVECLVKSGVDLETARVYNLHYPSKPLELAITQNHPEIVKILLDQGADSFEALNQAIKLKNDDMVKFLLDNGVKFPRSALSGAVKLDNESILKLILEKKGFNINDKNMYGETPLIEALRNSQNVNPKYEIIELLLKHGADPDIPDRYGRLMIHQDTALFNPSIKKLLDRYGTKYFDVHIEGDQFYITQSQLKPRNGFALSALENIEKALKEGLTYNSAHKDNSPRLNPALTNDEALKLLSKKADEIAGKYKTAVTDSILPRNFTDEKKVKETHERIQQLIQEKNLQ